MRTPPPEVQNPEDRWPQFAGRITGAADQAGASHVDVLMLCEVVDWHRYGNKQLARAMRDLDLDAAPLAPTRSGYGTGLLYRREALGRCTRHNPDFGKEALHGLDVTSSDIPGLPAPLNFLPVHFTPFSAEQAVIEADYAATRDYRYGPFTCRAVTSTRPQPRTTSSSAIRPQSAITTASCSASTPTPST